MYNIGYMAKRRSTSKKASNRKKSTRASARSKEVAPEHELPGGFWRQIMAVLMLVLAVVLIFAWLGDGGPVLNSAIDGLMWLIGYAQYLLPFLLVWLAVKIFRTDDNRLPVVMWLASFLMIFWVAGIAGIPTIGESEPTGGIVGEWLNGLMTQVVNAGVAIFIYVVLMFVTAIFILQTNPLTVFRGIAAIFRTGEREDRHNERLARRAEKGEKVKGGDLEIKVNSGVAVDDTPANEPMPLKTRLAGKPAKGGKDVVAPEPERALVAVSDPNWKMPDISLLEKKQSPANPGDIQQNAQIIKTTLGEFGIEVEMEGANETTSGSKLVEDFGAR